MALERDPLGRKAVAYFNNSVLITDNTTSGIETWLLLGTTDIAGDLYDVGLGITPEFADITTRRKAAGGFTARKPVIREGEITFDISWETNNSAEPFVQNLIDAANADTPLAMAFLDYAFDDSDLASGEFAQGLVGNFYVPFTKNEAIRDAQRASVTATSESLTTWFKHSPS